MGAAAAVGADRADYVLVITIIARCTAAIIEGAVTVSDLLSIGQDISLTEERCSSEKEE